MPNGSYTLTPAKTGYIFSPVSLKVTVAGSSVTGRNFAAVPRVATVRITLPAAGTSASRKAYRMIGIPVIPGNSDTFATLSKFFGGTADSSVWRLYTAGYTAITRSGQDSIRYGKGWWIVSAKTKTLAISGTPKATDFTCTLTSDYQMIACPFVDGNVSWAKVRSDSDKQCPGAREQHLFMGRKRRIRGRYGDETGPVLLGFQCRPGKAHHQEVAHGERRQHGDGGCFRGGIGCGVDNIR